MVIIEFLLIIFVISIFAGIFGSTVGLGGLARFDVFSLIEPGAVFLIAAPVSRVLVSVFLFATEGDRLYVLIMAVVFALLLFSVLVTPFIPGFYA